MTDPITDTQEVEALCKLAEERDRNGVSFNANGIALAAMLRRLLAERDAAFAAGAEAMRQKGIDAIEALGTALTQKWRDGRKCDSHLEGRAYASDDYAAVLHAIDLPQEPKP